MERRRRGSGDKLIIKGAITKKPKYWKGFLSDDENKHQLIKLMLNVWQTNLTALHLPNQSLILICEKETFHLHSKNTKSHKMSELKSSQEKADTKTFQKGYKNVHLRTPDSDIFFICLYYAKTELQGLNVFIDTGNGNNRQLIDVTGYAAGLLLEKCFDTACFDPM